MDFEWQELPYFDNCSHGQMTHLALFQVSEHRLVRTDNWARVARECTPEWRELVVPGIVPVHLAWQIVQQDRREEQHDFQHDPVIRTAVDAVARVVHELYPHHQHQLSDVFPVITSYDEVQYGEDVTVIQARYPSFTLGSYEVLEYVWHVLEQTHTNVHWLDSAELQDRHSRLPTHIMSQRLWFMCIPGTKRATWH